VDVRYRAAVMDSCSTGLIEFGRVL
jgi:hypothetical protein